MDIVTAVRAARFRRLHKVCNGLGEYARTGTLNWTVWVSFWGEAGHVLETPVGREVVQRWVARHQIAFSDLGWVNQYPHTITPWVIKQMQALLNELRRDLEEANMNKLGLLFVYLNMGPQIGFQRAMIPVAAKLNAAVSRPDRTNEEQAS